MSTLTLVDLDASNWERVADLRLHPHQIDFVAPNLRTIAETQFYPWVRRRVIQLGGEIIGFAAYGQPAPGEDFWLHRFMIDVEHQGQGYGRTALTMLVDEWRLMPGVTQIKVSYHPDNTAAEHLYTSLEFVPGEIADWGERVAVLDLSS
jgi:diamine N-acetyltransferase